MRQLIKFSVCMSVYNGDNPEWFSAAVDSVLHQTVLPDEIVLVVDGPVPEQLDIIIRAYEQQKQFRVMRLERNQGLGHARRVGLELCSHELVALMDADDVSMPDRFEKQLTVFDQEWDVSVVGGQISEFLESTENVVGIRNVPLEDSTIKAYLQQRCPMNHVTVMLKKMAVMQVGGYIDWYFNEDYYLWVRMYLAGMKFANVPDILVNVRVGADMYRRRGGWKYFCSEFRLQNYMLKNRVIGPVTYTVNVAKRLIVQVLLPNRLRGWVFRKFARTTKTNG